MRIELRNGKILLDGYVNAVARDSRPMLDEIGEKFVEQISPKAFQRALEKNDDILCLLDHDLARVLASTKQGNLELFEDNIGLRAICEIDDAEIVQKAIDKKLRGWSFGFTAIKQREEPINSGIKRRIIDDLNLFEVSIIDDQKIPCYVGTSIETRAEESLKIEYRGEDFKPKIFDFRTAEATIKSIFDCKSYFQNLNKIIKNLECGICE